MRKPIKTRIMISSQKVYKIITVIASSLLTLFFLHVYERLIFNFKKCICVERQRKTERKVKDRERVKNERWRERDFFH